MPLVENINADSDTRRQPGTRVLLMSMYIQSNTGCRLPSELVRAGFDVGALCTTSHALSYTKSIERRYTAQFPVARHDLEGSLRATIEDWRPSLVIPCDDMTIWFLNDTMARRKDDPDWAFAMSILYASSPDPAYAEILERKSLLPVLAGRAGVRMPATITHEDRDSTVAWAQDHGFQVVVKGDHTAGGNGVTICRSREGLEAALARGHHGREAMGRVPKTSVQRWIRGRVCSVIGVARGGRVLSRFSFSPETSSSEVAPSCVIRRSPEALLTAETERMIEACRFTGFFAIDYVICAETGQKYVIDFNGRVSQSTHLGRLMGGDLCEALHRSLDARPRPGDGSSPALDVIALFPAEWRRDPESPHLTSAYHDVPWSDPHLLSKLMAGKE